MKTVLLCVSVVWGAGSAQAYDSRSGDRLVEMMAGVSGLALSVSQLMTQRLHGGVLLRHTFGTEYPQQSLSLSAGYEHHQNGWALVPRAGVDLGIGLVNGRNPTAVLGLRTGAIWYPVRALGVAAHAGATLWGNGLLPGLGVAVAARF